MSKVIVITSGKGGVGKTTSTANIGSALSALGKKVVIVDADIGLRNARLNFRQVEETHIMENIIYNDLIRRGYNVDVGVVEYNQTEENKKKRIQLEVDFVVNRGNIRYYIQSALALNSEEKKEQEINSLKRIDDSFKKIVVVKDDIIPRYDEQGIYYIGIKDFLLTDSVFEN